jgi:hypothetical protein
VSTTDYYNYTCVDYARQAGMSDTALYLQQKLNKTMGGTGYSSAVNSLLYRGGTNMSQRGVAGGRYPPEWIPNLDPSS